MIAQESYWGKEMATHSSILAWRISDRGARWAAVYGVAQSWTRLKRLSSSSKKAIGTLFNEASLLNYKTINKPARYAPGH